MVPFVGWRVRARGEGAGSPTAPRPRPGEGRCCAAVQRVETTVVLVLADLAGGEASGEDQLGRVDLGVVVVTGVHDLPWMGVGAGQHDEAEGEEEPAEQDDEEDEEQREDVDPVVVEDHHRREPDHRDALSRRGPTIRPGFRSRTDPRRPPSAAAYAVEGSCRSFPF